MANNSDYDTTTSLNDALEVFYDYVGEDQLNDTAYTLEAYNFCHPSARPEELLTCSVYHSFIYLMYTIVFFVSVIGNGLVCFVTFTTPQMRTVTNIFIANLAIGDIVTTVFYVPFSFVSALILEYWPFGLVMCKVVSFVQIATVLISANVMLSISIDRYITIMWPLRPRMRKATAKMVIAAVWLGACVTAAPTFNVTLLYGGSCYQIWEDVHLYDLYNWTILVLQFVLPLSVMACTYAHIAVVVWVRQPPGEAQDARDLQLQKSKRKMIKMMVTVVLAFIMCWLPLNIYNILTATHTEEELGFPYTWFACQWLATSHCCYNPFIYYYMNSQYKEGFKKVFRWFFRMCQNNPSRHDIYRKNKNTEIPLCDRHRDPQHHPV